MSRLSLLSALLLGIGFFTCVEIFARSSLFDMVSYTNSAKLDASINYSADLRDEINTFAIGSSEILYGLDPEVFDELAAINNCPEGVFNFGIEGFGPTHFEIILENVMFDDFFSQAKIALIGINMFEPHDTIPTNIQTGFECARMAGELQKSVYTSGFGRDNGLAELCPHSSNQTIFGSADVFLSRISYAYRHRQSLRSLILNGDARVQDPSREDVQKRIRPNGFYYSAGMNEESYAFHTNRWRTNFSQISYWQNELDLSLWQNYISENGIFDRIARQVEQQGYLPVFVANPSNPMMIEDTDRQSFYQINSQTMTEWAQSRGYAFLDAGILDSFDRQLDFEDHRHTSGEGAKKASETLASQFYKNPVVRTRLGCGELP